jgi:hypothetical protein
MEPLNSIVGIKNGNKLCNSIPNIPSCSTLVTLKTKDDILNFFSIKSSIMDTRLALLADDKR